jgi:hypothetical protein
MIRSAFLHLATGMLIGTFILWQKGPGGFPGAWRWLPLHIHFLLSGWIVQLALGVAYWIMPRFALKREGQERFEQVRGREPAAWLGFGLLNASTLVALATLLEWRWALAASGLLILLAGLSFVVHLWPRIKPFMS